MFSYNKRCYNLGKYDVKKCDVELWWQDMMISMVAHIYVDHPICI